MMDDPLGHPREYRASIGWLVALLLCGGGLAIGGLFGAWYSANSPLNNAAARPWLIGLCLLAAGFGTYLLLSLLKSRVMLYPDRIAIEELTRVDVLRSDELRGWRLTATWPCALVLIPKDPTRRTVTVALLFRIDTELAEWLDKLPFLDLVDQETSEAEILNEPQFGTSPDERAAALRKGRRLAKFTDGASITTILWGFVYPEPYELVMAAQMALPWVAIEIMRRSRGLFRADQPPNDAHPTVALPLILPGGVLLVRSVLDYNFVNALATWWCALSLGALLWWAVRSIDPSIRKKPGSNIAFALFSIVYGFGAALQANTLLDRSPEAEYRVHVERKRVESGSVTRHVLEVEPWAPGSIRAQVQVSRATYEHIQPGDVVRLVVRDGALGAAWYYMRAWERGKPSTNSQHIYGERRQHPSQHTARSTQRPLVVSF